MKRHAKAIDAHTRRATRTVVRKEQRLRRQRAAVGHLLSRAQRYFVDLRRDSRYGRYIELMQLMAVAEDALKELRMSGNRRGSHADVDATALVGVHVQVRRVCTVLVV